MIAASAASAFGRNFYFFHPKKLPFKGWEFAFTLAAASWHRRPGPVNAVGGEFADLNHSRLMVTFLPPFSREIRSTPGTPR